MSCHLSRVSAKHPEVWPPLVHAMAFLPSLPGPQEEDGEVALVLLGRPSPGTVGPEDMTLCSSRRAMRPGRRGLGPVPS